ncbi:MAG: hypothetical protein AAGA67_05955, partial [Cyanobacteria bacterium P01_F01_bin.153]
MTYPAPPPELPPQTTPAPQVVVQTPSAVARPEPAAPAPLRQVIEQLPPAKAEDLGRPMGVVDIRAVRESVGESASYPLNAPQNSASQTLTESSPTLPPLSNPATESVSTPKTSPAEGNGNADIGTSGRANRSGPGNESSDAGVDRVVDSSDRSTPTSGSSSSRLSRESLRQRSPGTVTNTPDASQEFAQRSAQNPAQNIDQRSPFEPEPLNPADEPIPPALPPTNRTPTTRNDSEQAAPNSTEPTGTAAPNPNIQRLDLPTNLAGAVEVTADQQEYDEVRNVVIAIGNAVVRFQGAVI